MIRNTPSMPGSERQHLIDVQEAHSAQIRAALAVSERVTLRVADTGTIDR